MQTLLKSMSTPEAELTGAAMDSLEQETRQRQLPLPLSGAAEMRKPFSDLRRLVCPSGTSGKCCALKETMNTACAAGGMCHASTQAAQDMHTVTSGVSGTVAPRLIWTWIRVYGEAPCKRVASARQTLLCEGGHTSDGSFSTRCGLDRVCGTPAKSETSLRWEHSSDVKHSPNLGVSYAMELQRPLVMATHTFAQLLQSPMIPVFSTAVTDI